MRLQQCSPADARLKCMAVPQRSCTNWVRRRWPPLGGVQSAGHRRCAIGVLDWSQNRFQIHPDLSQMANLKSQALYARQRSYTPLFLSPGAKGSSEPGPKFSLSVSCWLILVDFFAFGSALEKRHRKNIEKNAKIKDFGLPNPSQN